MNIWTAYALSPASAFSAASNGAADNVPSHYYFFDYDERHRELALSYLLWCPAAIPRKPLFPRWPAARPPEPRNAGGIANESRRMGNEPTASGSMSRGTPQPTSPQDISACSQQPIVICIFLPAQEHLDCKCIIGGISYSSCIEWCC